MLESLKFCECPQPDECKACQEEDDTDVEYTKQHNPFRHRYTDSYNHVPSNLAIFSHETYQDKLTGAYNRQSIIDI